MSQPASTPTGTIPLASETSHPRQGADSSMPRTGRSFDFLDEFSLLKDRVRRLELRSTGGNAEVESFIMDPVTVRAWPVALAADMTINGVMLYIAAGFADVTFWVVSGGT